MMTSAESASGVFMVLAKSKRDPIVSVVAISGTICRQISTCLAVVSNSAKSGKNTKIPRRNSFFAEAEMAQSENPARVGSGGV